MAHIALEGSMEQYHSNLLFDGISRETMEDLGLCIEERRCEEGMILFEEGATGGHLYLVLEGKIRISKKGRFGEQETLTEVEPRGFFGEMALLDGRKRSARATAAVPSVVGLLDREAFERFLSHSPETSRHFASLISGQLRSANSSFIHKLLQAERLSLLGTMMSSIVHDIRNPIATLAQVSQSLSVKKDPRLLNLGRITEDAVEQMMAMIQELLDFSRGKVGLELQTISIAEFINSLDKQVLGRVENAGITVNREIEYDAEISADRQRLLRLFHNVIKNSWDAMTSGGSLTLRVRREDDRVHFAIEDTGCGIDPEILKQVFEPFVTHGKKRGTGLGMAIAKSVVEAHQGTIRMESELGKGTSCLISLPVQQPIAGPSVAEESRRLQGV